MGRGDGVTIHYGNTDPKAIAHDAALAFWKAVAEAFPHVKTGDLDPLETVRFADSCERVVLSWMAANDADGWLRIEAYGNAFRITPDGLEYAAMYNDGRLDLDNAGLVDPFSGVEDWVLRMDHIVESYLKNPDAPENATLKAYFAAPASFEGELGDALPIICEQCGIHFGDSPSCSHSIDARTGGPQ